eukprot:TRINITY_DN12687_c0_g1_i1.p1 TRINITY_DN12687_c0_g1~~TRINITY_DN12687_c0_g1_i1.p1  ORF type:complete len:240 (-),score=55.25 TRINITY_DN12687_c0_g1_i1:238-957(-)
MATEWELTYWPGFPGRGEYIKLLFEDSATPYTFTTDTTTILEQLNKRKFPITFDDDTEREKKNLPVFAPPILRHNEFVLCQTHACQRYLAKKLGYLPGGGEEDEAHAEQFNLFVLDYISEGRRAFHPVNKVSYKDQMEEAAPHIALFLEDRFALFFAVMEKTLARNNAGEGFLFGDRISYPDLTLFHALSATKHQWPAEYAALEVPHLEAFHERIAARPNLAAYLASERRLAFAGDSLM